MTWTKNEIVSVTVYVMDELFGEPITFRIVDISPTFVSAVPWMRKDLQEEASAFMKAFNLSIEKDAVRYFDPQTGEQIAPFALPFMKMKIAKIECP